MNPSFTKCAFKLFLPTCIIFEGGVKIEYTFVYRKGNTEKLIYYDATLTDKLKNVCHDKSAVFFSTEKMQYKHSIFLYQDKKKILVNGARLEIAFLSDAGQRTVVSYIFDGTGKAKLLDVMKYTMSSEKKKEYIDTLMKAYSLNNESAAADAETDDGEEEQESIIDDTPVHPALEEYIGALKTEKAFLSCGCDKKYKVTNGKRISSGKGIFSYVFDLETELYIADDAPIKLQAGSGIHASGNVLMCEDFQMIVQVDVNIGDIVPSAVISVEPWKLLEAIEIRLHKGVDIKRNKIALKLIEKGHLLATDKPVEGIPKGQNEVLEKMRKDPICIVWGPPGTGKTYTMSKAAIRFMNEGKKVLIVSHSNVSVDGVAKQIYTQLLLDHKEEALKAGKVLRYGYIRDEELGQNPYVNSFHYTAAKTLTLNQKLEKLLEEFNYIKNTKGLSCPDIIGIKKDINKIHAEIREMEQYYVGKASIVATTISKVVIDKLFEDRIYDVVMFDEVSMAYVPQVICAATFCREHFICVGDFMQLAPIAQSKAQELLCKDIFSYLGINRNGKPYFHPWLVMLDEQRRMHPDISRFSNKNIYRNLLKDHPSVLKKHDHIVNSEICKEHAVNLIDLAGSYCAAWKNADNSRFNLLSAFICFAAAVKTEENVETVSIITPYAAQTRLVNIPARITP